MKLNKDEHTDRQKDKMTESQKVRKSARRNDKKTEREKEGMSKRQNDRKTETPFDET